MFKWDALRPWSIILKSGLDVLRATCAHSWKMHGETTVGSFAANRLPPEKSETDSFDPGNRKCTLCICFFQRHNKKKTTNTHIHTHTTNATGFCRCRSQQTHGRQTHFGRRRSSPLGATSRGAKQIEQGVTILSCQVWRTCYEFWGINLGTLMHESWERYWFASMSGLQMAACRLPQTALRA